MSIEDYTRNLRGVNDGIDFTPEFLVSISRLKLNTSMNNRPERGI